MRVSIEHKEKQVGFIRKKKYHAVTCRVDFSEEEMQIIKQGQLWDMVVLERSRPANEEPNEYRGPDFFNLTVGDLSSVDQKGNKLVDEYCFATPHEAREYELQLTEALKTLKSYLQHHAGLYGHKETTFEL